jgi:hypothetical protein
MLSSTLHILHGRWIEAHVGDAREHGLEFETAALGLDRPRHDILGALEVGIACRAQARTDPDGRRVGRLVERLEALVSGPVEAQAAMVGSTMICVWASQGSASGVRMSRA